MSISAINWGLAQSLTGCCKFVLIILALHANEQGKCWPSLKLISKECGISRASVIKHLNELERLGLISKRRRHDDRGYRRSTLYELNVQLIIKQSTKSQRRENQSKENLRRDSITQSLYFATPNVQELDGNIIERSLEQKKERSDTSELEASPYPSENQLDITKVKVSSDVMDVFQYWREVLNHPQAKLDDKRKNKIKNALKLGYSIEELKLAIKGCSQTPFNMGENDRKQKYDDIELILRDASHIDRFISTATTFPTLNNQDIPTWMASAI